MSPDDRGRGVADPARSLALLWGARGPDARSRSNLGVEKIVREAIDMVDTDGLGELSMRRLAQALGVGVMSLYTYVPGKAELIELMVDTVYGETLDAGELPAGWRAALEQVARANWALYRRHPWVLRIPVGRPSLGPHATAKYEYELRAVEGLGLTEVEMDSVVRLVTDYAEGAARRAVEASVLERESGLTDEQWWRVCGPLLGAFVDGSRYPVATRVGSAAGAAHGGSYSPEHAFEFGLERMLDGIEVFIASRTTRAQVFPG
ncbi:TetR/AcrR family transcriptional regulator [Micromonospora arborensis]|uniref:TetR/AcrR family transcriptional regulator n=1 Tax=Micromonospora arborensis TaxID=2116518 RepID=A0A318NB53_9ACTN|nr:TetR/AcrR family transcriptional regulator C-terminal domain-containing protein [Micromonospora arborensis]PYC64827.1 TetR/AcrR family transcriptional regulator [Micromonospora arborensis]